MRLGAELQSGYMKDFFISYTGNDRAWAEWIAWILEDAGFTVVIQAWDFKAGQDFVQRMEEALSQTRKLIAVLSQDYFDAKYTNAEWRAAFAADPSGGERRLLPIRVKECQLPHLLASRIYVDLVNLTEEDARVMVVRAADESCGRPSSRPEFPGGVHKPSQRERAARVVKSFPGVAIASPSLARRWVVSPDLGPVVSKCCDRDEQEDSFDNNFRDKVKRQRGCPQMYIVHGPVRERHASLVERWRKTLIQQYADHLSGQTKAAVTFWEAEKWPPPSGNVETDLSRLIEFLCIKCDTGLRFEPYAYTPQAFRELVLPLRGRVIVVQHEIDATKWTPNTERLIGEYMNFWEAVKADADIPHFLIFLNVVYPAGRGGSHWKVWEAVGRMRRARENRRIVYALNRVCEGTRQMTARDDARCFYTLLEELPCVELKDVEAWFKKFRLGQNEVAWETQSRNLFRLKGWKFKDGKNMAEVEDALDEFITVMAKSAG